MQRIAEIRFIALAACLILAGGTRAATLTWDVAPGDGTAITEGTGNWADLAGNWNNGGDATWNNATPDQAIIGGGTLGSAGTITLTTGITAGGITFNAPVGGGNYTVTGNTLTMANGSSITVNAPGTSTIQSTLIVPGGGNTVTVTGTGDLTLGGQVGNGTQFQLVMTGSGTLTLGDNATGVDNNNMGLTANSGTVLFNKASSASYHAVGANMTIAGALVRLVGSGGDQIYNGMNAIVNSGTFDLNGLSETVNTLAGSGGNVQNSQAAASTLTLNGTAAGNNNIGAYAGSISGNINIVKNGAASYSLNGNNTFVGTVTVTGTGSTNGGDADGVLGLAGDASLGNAANGLVLNNGGTLFNGYNTPTPGAGIWGGGHGNLTLGTGRTVTMGSGVGGVIRVGWSDTLTLSGPIDGSGALTKVDSGQFNLDGANTYAGLTTVKSGILCVRHDSSLGETASGTVVNNGASLQVEKNTVDVTIAGEPLSITGTGSGGTRGALASWSGNNAWNGPITLTGNSTLHVQSGRLTVGGVIDGAYAVTKTGGGTLRLANANTYAGKTTLNSGLLELGTANALPTGFPIEFTTAADWTGYLKLLGNDQTTAGIADTTAHGVIENTETEGGYGPATLTLDGSASYSFNGVLRDRDSGTSGATSLVKQGTGTQTLSGTRIDYTGTTAVLGGRLVFADMDDSLGSGFSIAEGAVLEISTVSRKFQFPRVATISGGGTLLKTGANEAWIGANGQVVNVSLGASGSIDVQGGVLRNEYGAANWTANLADMNVAAGATFKLWDAHTTLDALTGAGTVSKGQNNTRTLTLGSNSGTGTFAGSITTSDGGSIDLIKTGTGNQTLGGVLSHSGSTAVNQGTLTLSGAAANTTSGLTTVNTGGTLALNKTPGVNAIGSGGLTLAGGTVRLLADNQIVDTLTVTLNSGTFDLNGCSEAINILAGTGGVVHNNAAGTTGTLTLGANNGGGTYARLFSDGAGALALAKVGTAEVILTNAGNSYSGGTTVAGGLLRATDSTIGIGGLTLQGGGIFFNVGGSAEGNVPADANFQKPVTLGAGGGGFRAGWGDFAVSGAIAGPGGLTIVNDGALTLTHTGNSYGGHTRIGAAGSGNNATLVVGASEVIPNGAGKGNVVFNASAGGTGTLRLSGFSETINGLTSGGAGANVVENTTGAATLTVGDGDATSAYAGLIRDNGGTLALTKTGAGTLTLGDNNSYSGATTVEAGQLLIDGAPTGMGTYTVNGGHLGGRGTVATAVNLSAGGGLAPGGTAAVAAFTLKGTTTLTEGATLRIHLEGANPGTEHDQLLGGGTGDLRLNDATLVLTAPEGFEPPVGTEFVIVSGFAARSGMFGGLPPGAELLAGKRAYVIRYGPGNDITLTARKVDSGTVFLVQ